MLELFDIRKRYYTGDTYVDALKGVSINFRESEFVAILGQSGCGKTTLLNIIGGLDRYSAGDLVINGVSTKEYKDRDWDIYRNHSIGFVFQSYNLIPHQSVLSNVELALTISGVGKEERRRRAVQALERVGLGDQIHKKPNQMSGGQMQRVAIARALVNDPDILLADEPTGALDSQTSVQVMEILKEISKDKLIIMVTHNPELATLYANRIVRLRDGIVTDDTNPYTPRDKASAEYKDEAAIKELHVKKEKAKGRKTSMSFFTALSLSLKNLLTKKTRTILTSFAGSIGIIGIALILSVSQGFQKYVDGIERDTVSGYPIQIDSTTMDMSAMMSAFAGNDDSVKDRDKDKVYSNEVMVNMMTGMLGGIRNNNLKALRTYFESDDCKIYDYASDIKYSYGTKLNPYIKTESGTYKKGLSSMSELFGQIGVSSPLTYDSNPWIELVGDSDDWKDKYDVLDGRLPENDNETVIIVDKNNGISDFVLYCLGIRDSEELKNYIREAAMKRGTGEEITAKIDSTSYTFDEIKNFEFKVLANSDYYKMSSDGKSIVRINETEEQNLLSGDGSVSLKIVGIVSTGDSNTTGGIGYKTSLMTSMIERANNSDVVKAQRDNPTKDLITGSDFKVYTENDSEEEIKSALLANKEFKKQLALFRINNDIPDEYPDNAVIDLYKTMNGTTYAALANQYLSPNSYDGNLEELGYVDFTSPISIMIYPKDFESKDKITEIIENYNKDADEADKITYTDMVSLLMKSVTTIVNAVSYVLIAFVSISLVVSSIMIGIITYISVLERTKEIGILRAIGASKRDISRVFNAETVIVGFAAGLIGIIVSLILIIPINIVLHALTGVATLSATLPALAAVILVAISAFLTVIAGLIPSSLASKKDPVIALRSE